ncbi:hypothetical protein VKT23_020027 [Stygiomarasmius scandens]|uniref:Uncharacterized protein n=1 Tax=Marasmiellus scandens TaxID=2682957 RepID=A0ABR1ILW1_9AGAR
MRLKWTSPLRCPTLPNGADKPLPCPGLNENDEPRIPAYLKRSSVSGGGSHSLTAIAKEQFEDSYRRLTEKEFWARLEIDWLGLYRVSNCTKITNIHVLGTRFKIGIWDRTEISLQSQLLAKVIEGGALDVYSDKHVRRVATWLEIDRLKACFQKAITESLSPVQTPNPESDRMLLRC